MQQHVADGHSFKASSESEAMQVDFAAIQAAEGARAGGKSKLENVRQARSTPPASAHTNNQNKSVARARPSRSRRRVGKQRSRAGYSNSNQSLTEVEQRQLRAAEGVKNSRWLADSAFPRVFGKPPFHSYGWGNTDPIADANYLSSFNVAPLLHEANDKAEAQMEKVNFVYDSAVLHADPERYHARLAAATQLGASGVDPEEPLLLDTAKAILADEYSEQYQENRAFRSAAREASIAVPKAGATAKEVRAARAAAAAKLTAVKRERWNKEHPGEPFPDDVEASSVVDEQGAWGAPGGILPAALTHSMPLPRAPVNRKPVGILPTLPATVPVRKRTKGKAGGGGGLEERRSKRQQARSKAHSMYAAGSAAAGDGAAVKREWFESKAHDGKWVSTAALSQELSGVPYTCTDVLDMQQRQQAATSILARVPVSARRSFSAGVQDSLVWWPNMQGAAEHKCQVRPVLVHPPAVPPATAGVCAPTEQDATRSRPVSKASSVDDCAVGAVDVYNTAVGEFLALPVQVQTAVGSMPARMSVKPCGKPPHMHLSQLACSSAGPGSVAANIGGEPGQVETVEFHPVNAALNPKEYKHLPPKYVHGIRAAGLKQKPSLHAADAFDMYA